MTTAETTKRLPRALQAFKKEIKALPFKDRVTMFFNCNPIFDKDAEKKKEIILRTFTPEERDEFSGKYRPIQIAIETYADRVRTLKVNSEYFSTYISAALRSDDSWRYTADWLNLALGKVADTIGETEDKDAERKLRAIEKFLMTYRDTGARVLKFREQAGSYTVDDGPLRMDVGIATLKLRSVLCAIKAFLESLREFLQWVGEPQLFPEEFARVEDEARQRYNGPMEQGEINPDTLRKFPLLFGNRELGAEYLSIRYDDLPITLDIFGQNNLWANTYRKLFI